ncbi:MAG: NAD(P)-dependent glycerol-3-phosphate dehydrogenase [Spirochaetaceae bacterium]|jgi:glycerol-3-phosphate dehydrogenase (NAD(P)+)|nr:NAD(P)-dependent glycerol-3-phosphate dehydrogenase [Spirochaetaceae bacterium]
MVQKTIGVIGAGAWGTAVAFSLAREGHSVELWALETAVADEINQLHTNEKYLSGFQFPANLTATADIRKAAGDKDFIILASPSLFLASTVRQILDVPSIAAGNTGIGVLTKGFIPSPTGPKLILETLEEVLPASYKKNLVYISGPSHAEEVALGKVTGLIAASENPKNSIAFRELLKSKSMMVFSSFDVVGVQVCAAAKNVVAIAFGCLDALSETSPVFGDNTESLLLAAGLNEMQTIGVAMGATHAETFTSIAGVGDLDVTCRSKYGRNRRFGHDIVKKNILGAYTSLDDLIAHIQDIGYLPEGAVACKYVHEVTRQHNLKLPICSGLYRILNREVDPQTFIKELLAE